LLAQIKLENIKNVKKTPRKWAGRQRPQRFTLCPPEETVAVSLYSYRFNYKQDLFPPWKRGIKGDIKQSMTFINNPLIPFIKGG
jgi:hypothetical protein